MGCRELCVFVFDPGARPEYKREDPVKKSPIAMSSHSSFMMQQAPQYQDALTAPEVPPAPRVTVIPAKAPLLSGWNPFGGHDDFNMIIEYKPVLRYDVICTADRDTYSEVSFKRLLVERTRRRERWPSDHGPEAWLESRAGPRVMLTAPVIPEETPEATLGRLQRLSEGDDVPGARVRVVQPVETDRGQPSVFLYRGRAIQLHVTRDPKRAYFGTVDEYGEPGRQRNLFWGPDSIAIDALGSPAVDLVEELRGQWLCMYPTGAIALMNRCRDRVNAMLLERKYFDRWLGRALANPHLRMGRRALLRAAGFDPDQHEDGAVAAVQIANFAAYVTVRDSRKRALDSELSGSVKKLAM